MMRRKLVCALLMLAAIVLTLGAYGDSQEQAYKDAGKLLDDGKYAKAAEEFKALGSYEDSSQMALYAQARQAEEEGDYEIARSLYKTIPQVRDSQARCDDIPLHTYGFTWDSFTGNEDIVLVVNDGKFGYIDTAGKIVAPCEWDDADPFSEGLAGVKKDGKWGYVDIAGKLVIPCEWDYAEFFDDGLACVTKDGKSGYIDTAGRLVVPCEWEWVAGFDNGLACVKKDGRLGCIDSAGKLVIPCDYDWLFRVNGHFFAFRNGYLSIFDFEGRRVF